MLRSTPRAIPLAVLLLIAGMTVPAAAQEEAAVSMTASEQAAAELAARLPRHVAGMDLEGNTFTADEILAPLTGNELLVELAGIAAAVRPAATIVDTRNLLDPDEVRAAGLGYDGVGRR